MQRVSYLDGWRGMAIVGVLLGHFTYAPFINAGRFGVELFFVLSGRLMAEILFERSHSLPDFFKRRIQRVYLALFVFIVLIVAFNPAQNGGAAALSCLTFTYNYLHERFPEAQMFNHIWSLCVEEHLYIAMALIAFLHRKYRLPVLPTCSILAILMMTSGVVQSFAGEDYYAVYWRSDVRGASILCGAIAYLNRGIITPNGSFAGIASLVLGLIAIALNTNEVPDYIKYTAGTAILATALATLPSASPIALKALEFPLLRWFGLASFSLYLWQQPFHVLWQQTQLDRPTALALFGAMGLLSYGLVEKAGRARLLTAIDRYRQKATMV